MDINIDFASLLLAIAVTLAVGLCLPDALLLLGVIRIKRGILGGPEHPLCHSGAMITPGIGQQLAYLGFKAAGVYWEQMPAHKSFRELVFVSSEGDCFAAVYRLFNNDDPRVVFKTAFADGAYVLTQNYLGGMEAQEATLWAGGMEGSLVEVVAEHRRRVASLAAEGHKPLLAATMEDHVEAEWTYMEHPTVHSEHYGTTRVLLGMKLGFLTAGPAILALLGFGPIAIASVLLAQACVILLFRYYGAVLDRMLPAEEAG